MPDLGHLRTTALSLLALVIVGAPASSAACTFAPGSMFASPAEDAEVPDNFAVFVFSESFTLDDSYARTVDGDDLEIEMRFGVNDAYDILKVYRAPATGTEFVTSVAGRVVRVRRTTEVDTTPPDPPERPSLALYEEEEPDECVGSSAYGALRLGPDVAAFVVEVDGAYRTSGLATRPSVTVSLPDGTSCLTVRTFDFAGNLSEPSPPQCFEVNVSGCSAIGGPARERRTTALWALLPCVVLVVRKPTDPARALPRAGDRSAPRALPGRRARRMTSTQ